MLKCFTFSFFCVNFDFTQLSNTIVMFLLILLVLQSLTYFLQTGSNCSRLQWVYVPYLNFLNNIIPKRGAYTVPPPFGLLPADQWKFKGVVRGAMRAQPPPLVWVSKIYHYFPGVFRPQRLLIPSSEKKLARPPLDKFLSMP